MYWRRAENIPTIPTIPTIPIPVAYEKASKG